MTTRQAGPSPEIAEVAQPQRRSASYLARVGQMALAEGAGALVAGGLFLAREGLKPSGDGEATYDWLNKALVAMAVGLVVAIVSWLGWTVGHRRLRLADVPTALVLVVAPLVGFLTLSYSYYGSHLDE